MMVGIPTQKRSSGLGIGGGYTSFPRTTPSRSYSPTQHESQQSSPISPSWFSCTSANNVHKPDPIETGDDGYNIHTKLTARGRSLKQKHQTNNNNTDQPNPTMIETSISSEEDGNNLNGYGCNFMNDNSSGGNNNDEAPSLDEGSDIMGLLSTFGFQDKDDSNKSESDTLFERLYTGEGDDKKEEEGEEVTIQSEEEGTINTKSSVNLNPYNAQDLVEKARGIVEKKQQQNATSNNQTSSYLSRYQEANKSMERGRDSIFRRRSPPQQNNSPTEMRNTAQTLSARRSKYDPIKQSSSMGKTSPSTYEQKIAENMQQKQQQLVSPTVAMDRRRSRSYSRPRTAVQSVASNSSFFTANPSTLSTPARTNTTTTRRHRSMSRTPTNSSSGRSHSSRRTRRSRSRSSSKAPNKKDDYHNNLFTGAALIKEQLLRSMASADQAMDEAEREFMEEMIERGERVAQRLEAREANAAASPNKESILDRIVVEDTNDSFCRSASARDAPSPSRSSCVRFAAANSQDESVFESESKRLDNMMHIFAANSSTSSSANNNTVKRTSSDKENDLHLLPNIESESTVLLDDITPSSNNSPYRSQMISPMQNAKSQNDHAGQYFQESDVSKPMVLESVEERTVETNGSQGVKPVPTMCQQEPQQQTSPVADEALSHAQKAGPLWRSLVGNHVRFPSKWDSVLPPTAPTNISQFQRWSKWYYVARHRVRGDKRLNSREYGVRSRRSGGRILLRMVVRAPNTQLVCREIAIGVCHPNAKGIRKGDPLPDLEDVRDVWMAVRWVVESYEEEPPTLDLRPEGRGGYEGVLDNFLNQRRKTLEYSTMGSVLGHKRAVNNENVRAVFGDKPPMTTVDLHEDEVADILKNNCSKKLASLSALLLLKLFLFS